VSVEEIDALPHVRKRGRRRDFAELFALWNGRPPRDDEWPAPQRAGLNSYEWLPPELALLAGLVGKHSPAEIATILTARLQQLTGDRTAERKKNSVQLAMNRIGLQSSDVLGGLTIAAAAKEIGCRSILYHEIRLGRIATRRVGRYLVIDRDELERWKGSRVLPPKGFIRLAALRKRLGIRSDKLSEWARMGYVPSAIRCNPIGTREHSTQFGTWYVDPKVARKLLDDRRAGRPMPWWGKPEPSNLRITWTLWQKRQHPKACASCRQIWGPKGAPRTYEDYAERYHPLTHGEKRHLTRPWSPGLTPGELAHASGHHVTYVRYAIRTGALRATKVEGRQFISRTDAARWRARRCPNGTSPQSWMSIATAHDVYGFTRAQLLGAIGRGELASKVGDFAAQRGIRYVLKQQCREWRERIGFSEREAAKRAGVSVPRLRVLLRGVWLRDADRVPLDAINTVVKRLESSQGITIAAAARALKKPVHWVEAEIAAGTIRVLRGRWNKNRRYVTPPMLKRLQAAAAGKRWRQRSLSAEWLILSDAADLAGVSPTSVIRWSRDGDVATKPDPNGWRGTRYHRRSVMKAARKYWAWASTHYKRASPPAWLKEAA
jgi:transcriptional regulator with XRE-family HTH domain